jgi:high-affinity iron transporter
LLPSFLLSLREGLEIALLVGIVLGALRKARRSDLNPQVWWGVASAVIVSLLVAVVLQFIGASLEGRAEELFEGVTMLLAAGVLTWMIFWMQRQSRVIKYQIEQDVRLATIEGGTRALFILAFVIVVREGIELSLFLTASALAAGGLPTILGAILGLFVAGLLGWALFASTIRLNLQMFFRITSVLLIFFAAGLVAHGVHELNEAQVIPPVVEHLWDTGAILDENAGVGLFLKTLFGYNANPSLIEVIAYLGFFISILIGLKYAPTPVQKKEEMKV